MPPPPPQPEPYQASVQPDATVSGPVDESRIPESAPISSPTAATPKVPLSIYDTKPNAFRIFRRYIHGHPSIYPSAPTIAEVLNSPNYEHASNAEKRPWWSIFGPSLKSVTEDVLGPFKNASTLLLMHWMHTGMNSKSNPEIDRLVEEVLRAPGFSVEDLVGFNAAQACAKLDKFIDAEADPRRFLFNMQDGWVEGAVSLSLPCEKHKHKSESDAPKFEIRGIFYRRPLAVMKAALNDPTVETYHWMPYEEYWQASDSALPERIYSELYNSDAFIQESSRLQQAAGSEECVIMGIMVWSDGTHLANFGNASLWPIYIYFGNQSKYYRSQTAAFAAHHLAYIPKV